MAARVRQRRAPQTDAARLQPPGAAQRDAEGPEAAGGGNGAAGLFALPGWLFAHVLSLLPARAMRGGDGRQPNTGPAVRPERARARDDADTSSEPGDPEPRADDDAFSTASTAVFPRLSHPSGTTDPGPSYSLPPAPASLAAGLEDRRRALRERMELEIEDVRRKLLEGAEKLVLGLEGWFASAEAEEVAGHVRRMRSAVEALETAHGELDAKRARLEGEVLPALEGRKGELERTIAAAERRAGRKARAARELDAAITRMKSEAEVLVKEVGGLAGRKRLWDACVAAVWVVAVLWGVIAAAVVLGTLWSNGFIG